MASSSSSSITTSPYRRNSWMAVDPAPREMPADPVTPSSRPKSPLSFAFKLLGHSKPEVRTPSSTHFMSDQRDQYAPDSEVSSAYVSPFTKRPRSHSLVTHLMDRQARDATPPKDPPPTSPQMPSSSRAKHPFARHFASHSSSSLPLAHQTSSEHGSKSRGLHRRSSSYTYLGQAQTSPAADARQNSSSHAAGLTESPTPMARKVYKSEDVDYYIKYGLSPQPQVTIGSSSHTGSSWDTSAFEANESWSMGTGIRSTSAAVPQESMRTSDQRTKDLPLPPVGSDWASDDTGASSRDSGRLAPPQESSGTARRVNEDQLNKEGAHRAPNSSRRSFLDWRFASMGLLDSPSSSVDSASQHRPTKSPPTPMHFLPNGLGIHGKDGSPRGLRLSGLKLTPADRPWSPRFPSSSHEQRQGAEPAASLAGDSLFPRNARRRTNSGGSASLLGLDNLPFSPNPFRRRGNKEEGESNVRPKSSATRLEERWRNGEKSPAITTENRQTPTHDTSRSPHESVPSSPSWSSLGTFPRQGRSPSLSSASSAVTATIKLAGKRGWSLVRGRADTGNLSPSPLCGTPTGISESEQDRNILNETTRKWLQLCTENIEPKAVRESLIFALPLREAVVRSRLTSPNIEKWPPYKDWLSSSSKKYHNSRASGGSRHRPLSSLEVLDLGTKFTMPPSLLSEAVDSSKALGKEEHSSQPSSSSGADLALDRETARQQMLPRFVTRCLRSLETYGVQEEGIYRLSGATSHTARLRWIFDGQWSLQTATDQEFPWDLALSELSPVDCDINSVCSVLKAYLRELPEPLLTPHQLNSLDVAVKDKTLDSQRAHSILQKCPLHGWYLLRELAMHLSDITRSSVVARTKMTLTNLSLVLSPTLSIPVHLLRFIVQEHQWLFTYPPSEDVETKTESRDFEYIARTECLSSQRHQPGTDVAYIAHLDPNRQSQASSTITIHPRSNPVPSTSTQEIVAVDEMAKEAVPALQWLLQDEIEMSLSRHQGHSSASTSATSLSLPQSSSTSTDASFSSTYAASPGPQFGTSSETASSSKSFQALMNTDSIAVCVARVPNYPPSMVPPPSSALDHSEVKASESSPDQDPQLRSRRTSSSSSDKMTMGRGTTLLSPPADPPSTSPSLSASSHLSPSRYGTPTCSPSIGEGLNVEV